MSSSTAGWADLVKYLGSWLLFQGGTAVQTRVPPVCKATGKFASLRYVWDNKQLGLLLMCLYNMCVCSRLLFGCEVLHLTGKLAHTAQWAKNRFLHNTLHINLLDRHGTRHISAWCVINSTANQLKSIRLRWFGHAASMGDARCIRIALRSNIADGRRRPGRPCKRFADCVRGDLNHFTR